MKNPLFHSKFRSKSPSSSTPSSPSYSRPSFHNKFHSKSPSSSTPSSPSYSRPSSPFPSTPSHSRPSSPFPSTPSHSRPSSPFSPFSSTPSHSRPSSPFHSTFSESMMDENVVAAESIITKWATDSPSYSTVTSLFHEDRREAKEFLRSVTEVQKAMHFYSTHNSSSDKLVRPQILMQTAMKRLQKEFYQILSANRHQLDPESVSSRSSTISSLSDYEEEDTQSEDEIQVAADVPNAMTDLRCIVDCMISCGYGKECVKIYKIIRKAIVDEGIYRLGFDRFSSKDAHKMDWVTLEPRIKNWLFVAKFAIKTLFYGERILSDHVFESSNAIKESCFSDIAKEAAVQIFAFPESVAKCKKSPEKIFRFLDLYNTISDLWSDTESIFSYESTSTVRSQAVKSLIKLGEGIRTMFTDFESAIENDSSRTPVPGGGLHPLIRYVMNYICFLSDYRESLADILADYSFQPSPRLSLLQNSPTPDNPLSGVSTLIEGLILVLLCKLDGKAGLYKQAGLSYLFLANNLHYVVSKVRSCHLLCDLLGDDWVWQHESKIKQYAANYEQTAWKKVLSILPENPKPSLEFATVEAFFKDFNSAFQATYQSQSSWVVPDGKLKHEVRVSVAKNIVPAYRAFYDEYRVHFATGSLVGYTPEELEKCIYGLFS